MALDEDRRDDVVASIEVSKHGCAVVGDVTPQMATVTFRLTRSGARTAAGSAWVVTASWPARSRGSRARASVGRPVATCVDARRGGPPSSTAHRRPVRQGRRHRHRLPRRSEHHDLPPRFRECGPAERDKVGTTTAAQNTSAAGSSRPPARQRRRQEAPVQPHRERPAAIRSPPHRAFTHRSDAESAVKSLADHGSAARSGASAP